MIIKVFSPTAIVIACLRKNSNDRKNKKALDFASCKVCFVLELLMR